MNRTIHLKTKKCVPIHRYARIGKTVIAYVRKRRILRPETSVDYGF